MGLTTRAIRFGIALVVSDGCATLCRFSKGIKARLELIEDITQIIKAGRSSSSSSGDGDEGGASAFELILQALRENQTEVSSCCQMALHAVVVVTLSRHSRLLHTADCTHMTSKAA